MRSRIVLVSGLSRVPARFRPEVYKSPQKSQISMPVPSPENTGRGTDHPTINGIPAKAYWKRVRDAELQAKIAADKQRFLPGRGVLTKRSFGSSI